jgi:hypothetical protein
MSDQKTSAGRSSTYGAPCSESVRSDELITQASASKWGCIQVFDGWSLRRNVIKLSPGSLQTRINYGVRDVAIDQNGNSLSKEDGRNEEDNTEYTVG